MVRARDPVLQAGLSCKAQGWWSAAHWSLCVPEGQGGVGMGGGRWLQGLAPSAWFDALLSLS